MNNRLRNAIHSGVKFGGAFAVIALVRSLPVVVTGGVPASSLIAPALVSLAIFGGVAFVLVMLGVAWATPKSSSEPIVSTWFAWMVAAAFAGFIVGMLVKLDLNSFMYWGTLGGTVWTVVVFLMWVALRIRDGRRSDPSARSAEHEPTRQ